MATVSPVKVYNNHTRFTKKGNAYTVTNLGKKIGAGVGFGIGTLSVASSTPTLKGILDACKEVSRETADCVSPKAMKLALIAASAIGIGIVTLSGTVIGAIADKITNVVRANNADK